MSVLLDTNTIHSLGSWREIVAEFPVFKRRLVSAACCGRAAVYADPPVQKVKEAIVGLSRDRLNRLLSLIGVQEIRIVYAKNGKGTDVTLKKGDDGGSKDRQNRKAERTRDGRGRPRR